MVSVEVYPSLNLGILRLLGHVTVPEVKQGYLDVIRDPALRPDMKMFADARGVTEVTADFLSMLAATYSVLHDLERLRLEARCVMLVGSDTNFGMARMFQQVVASVSRLNIHVLADPGKAEERLGLPGGTLAVLLSRPLPEAGAGA